MTMLFRQLKAALTEQLGDAAAGRFRVLGYQDQPYGASEVLDTLRVVTVFYQSAVFEKRSSGWSGPVDHQATFSVELMISKSAKVDLSVIDDPTATDEERAAALLAAKQAGSEADDSMDELAEYVYQILMDNRNQDAGMDDYSLGDRWVSEFEKDPPIPKGDLVVLTGAFKYTVRLSEELEGVDGKWQEYVDQYGITRRRMVVGLPFEGASIETELNGRRDQDPETEVVYEYVSVGANHVTVEEDFVTEE